MTDVILVDNAGISHLPAFPWETPEYASLTDTGTPVYRTPACVRHANVAYLASYLQQKSGTDANCFVCIGIRRPYTWEKR